jgi:hypothetical protein
VVSAELDLWVDRHALLSAQWDEVAKAEYAVQAAALRVWERRLEVVRERQEELIRRGRWRSGPRTLLAALDLHYRELSMTAGLAWFLRPDGHHGLGTAVLTGLLSRLGISDHAITTPAVRVVLEEQRDQTRADLVVYGGDWTIVVEAKTYAVEQEAQLDRLWWHWQDEPGAHFVFLTRGARSPRTAKESREFWRLLTWEDIASLVETAALDVPGVAPGVHEYISTLEAYHRV